MRIKSFVIPCIALLLVSSCGDESGNTVITATASRTDQDNIAAAGTTIPDTTRLPDLSLGHLLLKEYLPSSLPGFKTEGYPDQDDKFTGEPTGETASGQTSGGRLSFVKHLFTQQRTEAAIEIVDYANATDTYHALYKMYDFNKIVDNGLERSELINTGIPQLKAKQVYNKKENNAILYGFLCDRFIITIQVINVKKLSTVRDILQRMKLAELVRDHCGK